MAGTGNKTKKRQPGGGAPKSVRRKKRRHGSYALYYMILAVFLLAGGIALSFTAFFNIETIEFTGAGRYSAEEMTAASGMQKGENLFRLDTGAARDRLLSAFPYMEAVRLRRRLPNAVHVEITLCKPAGALISEDEYMLITRDGKVLERGLFMIPENVPVVKGVNAGDVEPGEWLKMNREEEAWAERRIQQINALLAEERESKEKKIQGEARALLITEMEALERRTSRSKAVSEAMVMLEYLFQATAETGFNEITNVDVTDPYNMKIIFENRLLLNLGTESELSAKLTFLKEMIQNRLPPDAEGLINATNLEKRSVVLSPMPIEEAIRGRKRSKAAASVRINQPAASEAEQGD